MSGTEGGGGSIYGPMLVGVFINCTLYGTMVVQTMLYFQTCKRDARWIKFFVFYLLVCETLNTACDIVMMYEPLIIHNGALQSITHVPIMLAASPLITASTKKEWVLSVMISTPVQLFIAWRVMVMGKSAILPAIITFFSFTSFGGGIATSASICIARFDFVKVHKLAAVATVWLGSSAVADVIITGSLVYNLMSRRTGFAATDDIINRIIKMSIQTGLITAVSAVVDVTLPGVIRGSTFNFIWDFALSKLYTNTLLCTLNARGGWKVTSTLRDNLLFVVEPRADNMQQRSRIQIETGSRADPQVVPMQVFESRASYQHDSEGSTSAIKLTPEFVDPV